MKQQDTTTLNEVGKVADGLDPQLSEVFLNAREKKADTTTNPQTKSPIQDADTVMGEGYLFTPHPATLFSPPPMQKTRFTIINSCGITRLVTTRTTRVCPAVEGRLALR